MTNNSTVLTLVLYAVVLTVILGSTWVVAWWSEAVNWVSAGLISFAVLLLLGAAIGRRKSV